MTIAVQSLKYTSKIINSGALVTDTRLFLSAWDSLQSSQQNFKQIADKNPLGKTTNARLREELTAFKSRYSGDADLTAALADLVQADISSSILNPILYDCTASVDPLIHDFVVQTIARRMEHGEREITTELAIEWLLDAVRMGRTVGIWSPNTVKRIAQGLLSTLRDFGIIAGKAKKHLHQPFIPTVAFAFLAFNSYKHGISGAKLLKAPSWDRLLMSQRDVEQHFFDAHQDGLLHYQVAGSVIRVSFPIATCKEYAHVLINGTFR